METLNVFTEEIKEIDTARMLAFIFDGDKLMEASEHAELIEQLNIVENAFDTDEDPRDLFPEDYIIGITHKISKTNEIIYEIVNDTFSKETLAHFKELVGDCMYTLSYSRVFIKMK